ncbi:LURP-one-related/scramblase family protein [Candidatus Enterococcus murrayae]|uniref:LURP-one-related family protein n=1 Tax=Candidatus Enterococcus murrayae TaxID=2815321 RepID=A0ABS3HL39_9ENTE|nr:LURP-one-related family protein [Enterococcus sp. MJM16]MBO0454159.1 LURP-one-related family protein [Enterococcus sp. MJM16]
MKKLYIKQKVFSIGEKFTVMDEEQQPRYFVKGSFMKIPKTFSIEDERGHEISRITKKVISLLPKFFVEMNGEETIEISKQLSFFKAKYSISAADLTVNGNWWDMDFEVLQKGQKVADINKRWISWGDTYEITILNETLEELIISLVIAIDCVKEDEAASASSSN